MRLLKHRLKNNLCFSDKNNYEFHLKIIKISKTMFLLDFNEDLIKINYQFI